MCGCARLFLAALVAAGCSPAARPRDEAGPPASAAKAGPPANLELRVREVVERPELDGLSYARVFVAGEEKGRTDTGPRSGTKRWEGRLEPGNHPVRLELWVLPGLGEWERLPDPAQPRERFVRIEAGSKAVVELRRHPGGRYEFVVSREREGG